VISLFKQYFKQLFQLLIFTIALASIVLLVVLTTRIGIILNKAIILTAVFSAISFTTLFIFYTGQAKEAESQLLYTLSGVVLKFLLDAVTALVWFVAGKNFQTQYVLLFFILYLAFTIFSIVSILNVLNNKGL
jgi:hypothetical protein